MGRAALLLLALAACGREPTFDERYDNAQAAIQARSESIDNELRTADTNVVTPDDETPTN